MIKPWPLTVDGLTCSKKQAGFRNFKLSDDPTEDQPSMSSARLTVEQQQGALSATSLASTNVPSSSSGKSRPSLSRQISWFLFSRAFESNFPGF